MGSIKLFACARRKSNLRFPAVASQHLGREAAKHRRGRRRGTTTVDAISSRKAAMKASVRSICCRTSSSVMWLTRLVSFLLLGRALKGRGIGHWCDPLLLAR